MELTTSCAEPTDEKKADALEGNIVYGIAKR